MYNFIPLLAIPAEPFAGEELLAYIFFALGLTLIGLFSKYKIFLILTSGPLFYMLYHISDDTHEGYEIMMISLAGWLLINVYLAFTVDD